MEAKLDRALGTTETAEALAKGIERLAALGRELVGHKKDRIAARIKLARIHASYLDMLEKTAEEVRSSARVASGRATAARVSQGEIDLLDGINLSLLSDIVHVFEAAHDLEATIPKLVPIATRRLLGKRVRAVVAAPTMPPAPPADPGKPAG